MARPSPSCAHDDDRLRLPPASPSRSNNAEKKESTVRRLSQLCPPCATPSSNSSLDYRRSDARIVKNGFAASSGVSKSAKVVLVRDGSGKVVTHAILAAAVKHSPLLGDFLYIAVGEQYRLFSTALTNKLWADYLDGCRERDPDMPLWIRPGL